MPRFRHLDSRRRAFRSSSPHLHSREWIDEPAYHDVRAAMDEDTGSRFDQAGDDRILVDVQIL